MRLFSPGRDLYHAGMRIGCPSCNAVYQVPDEQLVEGRVVRCVRCGTDWSPIVAVPAEDGGAGASVAEAGRAPATDVQVAALPEVPAEVLPEPDPEVPTRRMALDDDPVATPVVTPATAEPPAEVRARRGGAWLAIAWVVSVLAVIGAVAALVVWRDAVMQAWPPSIRAYVALKLAVRP